MMKKIHEGYRSFRATHFPRHADLFRRLEKGQRPEVLFLTCSDSRIDPALVTQTLPGELFVIRNAGNLVSTRRASGVVATIEYAVRVLAVKHIVVCGHSHCGAVAAALAPDSLEELPYVAAWLDESGPDLSHLTDTDSDRLRGAIELNVLNQLDNLRRLPFVAEAIEAGKLDVHGWVYTFETGEVFEYDSARQGFVSLPDHTTDKTVEPALGA